MVVVCDDGGVFIGELVIELEEILLELMGEILFGLYSIIRHLYILFTTTTHPITHYSQTKIHRPHLLSTHPPNSL